MLSHFNRIPTQINFCYDMNCIKQLRITFHHIYCRKQVNRFPIKCVLKKGTMIGDPIEAVTNHCVRKTIKQQSDSVKGYHNRLKEIWTYHYRVLVTQMSNSTNSNNKNYTAQKMKFSIKDFFSKCDQIHKFLRIWSHLLKKSLIENFIFLCSASSGIVLKLINWCICYMQVRNDTLSNANSLTVKDGSLVVSYDVN